MSDLNDLETFTTAFLEQKLSPILELTEQAVQQSQKLLSELQTLESKSQTQTRESQDLAAVHAQLENLQHIVDEVSSAQQPILNRLANSYTSEMLGNLAETLELMRSQDTGTPAGFTALKDLCEFQLIPLCRITKEAFYFWGRMDKQKELRDQYYAHEFADHLKNHYVTQDQTLPYQVTVVVVAYNNLDSTKACVESVLQNTDFTKLNAELILVDHGSSDGTWEYFKSIPQARVIHFKHNMCLAMFPILPMICRSEYYVHVANDTVVTKDWLDILLTCIKSDPKIAIASPATCNISNYQDLNVPTKDCDELVALAAEHNQSNPLLWFERSQIYPPIGIFSVPILNQVGFWDPAIYTFYCCDDDFSIRARRAGFKQILCEDVYCFHRGHITVSSSAQEKSFQGGQLFLKKFGIRPWLHGVCYNLQFINYFKHVPFERPHYNILAINCGIGDTPLQLRNLIRHAGKEADIYHITTQPEFLNDIKYSATEVQCVKPEELVEAISQSFAGQSFDFVCYDSLLTLPEFTGQLLSAMASRMSPKALIAMSLSNPLFIQNVVESLKNQKSLSNITPENILNFVGHKFTDGVVVPHHNPNFSMSDVQQRLEPYKIAVNEALYKMVTIYSYEIFAQKPEAEPQSEAKPQAEAGAAAAPKA